MVGATLFLVGLAVLLVGFVWTIASVSRHGNHFTPPVIKALKVFFGGMLLTVIGMGTMMSGGNAPDAQLAAATPPPALAALAVGAPTVAASTRATSARSPLADTATPAENDAAAVAHLGAGNTLLAAGNLDGALHEYATARALAPSRPDVRSASGTAQAMEAQRTLRATTRPTVETTAVRAAPAGAPVAVATVTELGIPLPANATFVGNAQHADYTYVVPMPSHDLLSWYLTAIAAGHWVLDRQHSDFEGSNLNHTRILHICQDSTWSAVFFPNDNPLAADDLGPGKTELIILPDNEHDACKSS